MLWFMQLFRNSLGVFAMKAFFMVLLSARLKNFATSSLAYCMKQFVLCIYFLHIL